MPRCVSSCLRTAASAGLVSNSCLCHLRLWLCVNSYLEPSAAEFLLSASSAAMASVNSPLRDRRLSFCLCVICGYGLCVNSHLRHRRLSFCPLRHLRLVGVDSYLRHLRRRFCHLRHVRLSFCYLRHLRLIGVDSYLRHLRRRFCHLRPLRLWVMCEFASAPSAAEFLPSASSAAGGGLR